jgi:putative hydrolase of the HAD superfamily
MTSNKTVLVFDLDDTLYLERDFALSGYHAAGEWVKMTLGIEGFERRCGELFAGGRRTKIFDTALEELNLPGRDDIVSHLVDLYRNHAASIALTPDAARYLGRAKDGLRAVITDGPAAMQMGKIKAVGLEKLVDLIICTDCWGREFWKPHARAFETVEAWSETTGNRLVYVADNPSKDFVTPRARGWMTVRIARPERVHHVPAPDLSHEAHRTITSFDQLDECLSMLVGGEMQDRPQTL